MVYYIPKDRRPRLKEYKYSSVDKSLLSKYILNPYWTWLVEWVPSWVAPNLITLTGLLFVGVNFLTLLYFLPGLTCTPKPLLKSLGGSWDPLFPPANPLRHGAVGWSYGKLAQNVKGLFGAADPANVAPEQTVCPGNWIYFSWAAGLWIYQSLDAIDGKQARKTKTSGPLGEMFDHGCDAINTTLEVLLAAAAINLGQSWWAVASQTATLANFYLTTWEEYNTQVLFLSAFSGPVEGILMIVVLYIVTGIYGPGFWDQGVLSFAGLASNDLVKRLHIKDLPLNECFLVFGALGLVFNIISSSQNVIAAKRKKREPIGPALLGLLPFAVQTACHIAWLSAVPAILHGHLVPFCVFWGIAFAYQVGLLITAHTTKGPFPYWNGLMVWSALCAVDANSQKWFGRPGLLHASEGRALALVYVSIALAFAVYAFFIWDVVGEICQYLDMNCLTIKKKPAEQDVDVKAIKASAKAGARRSGRT